MEKNQADARINLALQRLRMFGWTTEQRERLVTGLQRDEAVEIAERAVTKAHETAQA